MNAIQDVLAFPGAFLSRGMSARGWVPSPLWALSAADRAISLPRRAAERRNRALQPVLRRPAVHNAVAADRLFKAVASAIGPDPMPGLIQGTRCTALECRSFSPMATPGLDAMAPQGLSLQGLVVLAGKHVDWRFTTTVLHVTHHAAVRFAERSRRTEPGDLTAATREAAAAADVILLGHVDGPLGWRLAHGSAPVILPAGPGVFLGYLRLIEKEAGLIDAVMEASTWVHEADLATNQADALAFLRAGLPAAEMLRHLPDGYAGIRWSASGDRRVEAGLKVAPMPARGEDDGCVPPFAAASAGARLRLGLACPDGIADERRKLRRAW